MAHIPFSTQPRHRKKIIAVSVCFICSTLLLSPPRLTAAEPLSGVAATASLMSLIISSFDSSADPTGTAVLQNRELIEKLHARLDKYGDTLNLILKKADALPDAIKKEIKRGLDEFQEDKVKAATKLILGDMKILAEGGTLGDFQIGSRLDRLQFESRAMFERKDLSVPVLILAMRYELALLEYIETRGEDKEVNKKVREKEYYDRFRKMLNVKRLGSLVHVFSSLNKSLSEQLNSIKIKLSLITKDFHASRCPDDKRPGNNIQPCMDYCTVNYSRYNSLVAKLKELSASIGRMKENEVEIYEFYYDLLSGMADLSPIYSDKSSFSGALSISRSPHGDIKLYPHANSDAVWFINESRQFRLGLLNQLVQDVETYLNKPPFSSVHWFVTPPPHNWIGCP